MARSKYEKRAQETLEERGWKVDWKLRPSFPNPHYNTDYFNIFDLLAIKDGKLRWISVKGKAGAPTDHQEDIAEMNVPGWKEIWRYDRDPEDRRCIRRRIWRFENGKRLEKELKE